MLFCIFHCGEWLGCLLLGNAGREHPGFPGQQAGMQEGSPVPGRQHLLLAVLIPAGCAPCAVQRPRGMSSLPAASPCSTSACFQLSALSYCLTSVLGIRGQVLLQKYPRLIPCTVPFRASQRGFAPAELFRACPLLQRAGKVLAEYTDLGPALE